MWAEETSSELNTGESISEYAVRRLKELQQVQLKASYDRRFIPEVLVGDFIRLRYPTQGLEGIFRVTGQKIELGHGARTSEEIEAV